MKDKQYSPIIVNGQDNDSLLSKHEMEAKKRLAKETADKKTEEYHNSTEYKIRQIAKQQDLSKINWSKIDNAGLIYPGIGYDNCAIFRLSVVLNREIDPLLLQKAVNDIVPRFPTIVSTLRAGLFWYYLDAPAYPLTVEEEKTFGCRPFRLDKRHSIARILYRKYEIIVEVFHTATDGSGGITFLNCLVSTYLGYCGETITDRTNNPHPKDKPRYEEITDSFQAAYNKGGEAQTSTQRACHIKAKKLPDNIVIHRKAVMNSSELTEAAHRHNSTVTQFLTACIMTSLAKHNEYTLNNDKKPLNVSVPCNLRKYYNSQTLRNFSSYFSAHYLAGSFDDTIAQVKKDFETNLTKSYFDKMINYNLTAQRNIFMRLVPLPIKNLVLRFTFKRFGYDINSASFSNLGVVSAPKEFEKYVVRYEFAFGASLCEPIGMSCATFNGTTVLTCSSTVEDTLYERELFSLLSKEGITLCAETTFGGTL